MDGLHWTGAALLLAVAVLGGRREPTERETIVSWSDFARQHGLSLDDQPVAARSPRRPRHPGRS